MKFSEFSEKEQIEIIKEEFAKIVETYLDANEINNADKYGLTQDLAKTLHEFSLKNKKKTCSCNQCIDENIMYITIPKEIDPVIDVIKNNLQNQVF